MWTACCGGCCLGIIVLISLSSFFFGWILLGDDTVSRVGDTIQRIGRWLGI